ncbi:MAG TPA: acyl-CoA dehydrogenase family protein, partial [Novosphingobium sp.]|nr:acyl-CoA dehydrogenase family protein [Novosphingobium sp.]
MPDRDESWKLVAEMGWLMIDLPEDLGGLGLGRDAAVAIHYEMGRVLSRAPLIPALLGLQGVAAADGLAEQENWIERICGGEYMPLHMLPARVEETGGAFSGSIAGVFDADMASHVLAALPGQYALIPLDAAGVSVAQRPVWDQSRQIFDVVLDGYRADPSLILAQGDAAT